MDNVRIFPAQIDRVKSGPIQFGDDWPGIFLRGDDANAISFCLQNIVEKLEKEERVGRISILYLKGMAKMLAECKKEIKEGKQC